MNKKLTEDEVVLALKDWLEKKRWTILSSCLGGKRGIDIHAKKSGVELLVEAKGARGNMPHATRTKFSKGQIKTHFICAKSAISSAGFISTNKFSIIQILDTSAD